MKKIASFTINHDTLEKGMYISRIDGDVVTYDIRMKKPNGGDYFAMSAASGTAPRRRNGRRLNERKERKR